MQKFFRKHMKKILAVSMALLLVVWLGGSALQSLLEPNYAEVVIAKCRDGDIRQMDLLRIQSMTDILDRVGLSWRYPVGQTAADPLTAHDWVMLTREARRLGFEPRLSEAEQFMSSSQRPRAWVNEVANRQDIAPEQVYAAVAEFRSVLAAASVVAASAQVSEAEVRVAARDANEKVTVTLAALRANSFTDPEQTFTDEEIQSFFEKYRDQERGQGMEFGYYLPPKVKVEFVKVDVEKVKPCLRLSEKFVERQAHRYWKENKQDPAFRRPPEAALQPVAPPAADAGDAESADGQEQPDADENSTEPGSDDRDESETALDEQPDSTDEPTDVTTGSTDADIEPEGTEGEYEQEDAAQSPDTQSNDALTGSGEAAEQPTETAAPAAPPPAATAPGTVPTTQPAKPSPYYESFAEAREAAIGVIHKQEASKRAQKIIEYIRQQAAEPWYDMPLGDDQYKTRPAGVDQSGYLGKLAAEVPPELQCADAVTTGESDWFTAQDAMKVPEVGGTWMSIPGGARTAFRDLAFRVQGLATLTPEADVDHTLFLAVYQPCALALEDRAGNLFIYRVTAVEDKRAPQTVDEVRDQVVEDLRKQRAYDEASRFGRSLEEAARKDGLEAAVEADTQLQEAVQDGVKAIKPQAFARKPAQQFGGQLAGRTYIPNLGFVDETFTRACFDLKPGDDETHAVKVIELPEIESVVVVQFEKFQPMDKPTYAKARPNVLGQLSRERLTQALTDWLNPELIQSRNQFEVMTGEG